ncbi:MAG: rRNA maturation RNase YbeY [Treponema sp.]|jgi:probable rRNA maturation factor|nr:rRNA maturation RNase YbeY [Treponema sp.]
MANNVLVSVEEGFPAPAWLPRVEPFMQKALAAAGYDGEELSVMFCSDALIQDLNREYRNIDEATDVLSFEDGSSYTDEDGAEWTVAGDIALSLETLPKNAQYFNVPADEELKRLLVHGMLHLNGYDHGEEHVEEGVEPACEMLKLQKQLLASLAGESLMGND